jgi:BlaI family transcriptional regulator, penicillinase repressor
MGKRKLSRQLTRLELQIMKVLWDCGASNVQLVQEKIQGPKLAYTTIQTMLNVLQRKGRVRRTLRGRAYEYRPVLSRDSASSSALRDLVDRLFGGSVDALLMSLVKSRQLDPEKLAKLAALIQENEAPDGH